MSYFSNIQKDIYKIIEHLSDDKETHYIFIGPRTDNIRYILNRIIKNDTSINKDEVFEKEGISKELIKVEQNIENVLIYIH